MARVSVTIGNTEQVCDIEDGHAEALLEIVDKIGRNRKVFSVRK